ncbi:MAG TPA: hypothetical protein VK729_07080 [Silvibacterium sp.]|nr:hypothetical protein [Silvibacterium sp.]
MAERWFQCGGKRRGIVRAIAMVCACLMMFAATAQVAHSHAAAQGPEHCQICMAIHLAMPAGSGVMDLHLGFAGRPVSFAAPPPPARVWVASLSDRAPPVLN